MKKILASLFLTIMFFNMSIPAFAKTKTEENNYIKIEQTTRHLHSRLSKKYTGYEYTIKNIYKDPVTIESISLWDDASGKVAYLSVKRTGLRAASETLGVGVALALPTLTVSLIASAVAVPFIIIGNQIGNIGANQEGKRFDKKVLKSVTLSPKEELKFKTLALHRHSPTLRVVFKNPLTEENMELDLK